MIGYTLGMKVAISIPNDVFEDAERLADRMQASRSQLYARAVAEFLARHDEEHVTAAMDSAIEQAGTGGDEFTRQAARNALERVPW